MTSAPMTSAPMISVPTLNAPEVAPPDGRRIARRLVHFLTGPLLVVAAGLMPAQADAAEYDDLLAAITLPDGFAIDVFAEAPGARSLALCGTQNVLYVGTRDDRVYAIRDADGDGRADAVETLATGLHVPNGIDCRDDRLMIALQDRVIAAPLAPEGALARPLSEAQTVFDGLPDSYHHGWRYARFGPDGRFHIGVGAPCNICETDGYEGTLIAIDPDGGNVETVASGIRNTVGFAWNPVSGHLFFSDNGADRMGDDIPPDELNEVVEPGGFYGFPYFGGKDIPLTGFRGRTPPATPIPTALDFAAHTASLGFRFLKATAFPADYRGDAILAQHGSWNRSVPIGYRLMRIGFDGAGKPTGQSVFAEGWLQPDGGVLGRPVDVLEMPDGSLLVSDDHAGLIYRITYGE